MFLNGMKNYTNKCLVQQLVPDVHPPYSGIYMEEVTDKAFREWNNLHPNPEHQLKNWARLIDDGFGTWQGSTNLLNELLEFLNGQVPSLKFTMDKTYPRSQCQDVSENHE